MQTKSKRPARDKWIKDGRAKGIYRRMKADGSFTYGYYADGAIRSAGSRTDALDGQAKSRLRKSAGLPAPDRRVLIRDLAEEVREAKRRTLRGSSFAAFEFALDKILLPELGHLKPGQLGPDRVATLIRELESRGLKPSSIRRYLSPLAAIYKLAIRRGVVATSPLAVLSDDERPKGGGTKDHYVWSPEEVSRLIAAADELGKRSDARYDYAPLIQLLVLTGLRVSEALALRWLDVDLLGAELHVRGSWSRSGEITATKTEAGRRVVPLSPGLVDLFVQLKSESATDEDFVFASTAGGRPISYWNFRRRGFVLALKKAGLAGKGITIHGLRSAAISIYSARGLTLEETATVMGQRDPQVTWRHYYRLFDKSDVHARVRAAQSSIDLT